MCRVPFYEGTGMIRKVRECGLYEGYDCGNEEEVEQSEPFRASALLKMDAPLTDL